MSRIKDALAKARKARAELAALESTEAPRLGRLARRPAPPVLDDLIRTPDAGSHHDARDEQAVRENKAARAAQAEALPWPDADSAHLVHVDVEALRDAGMLAPASQERRLAEEYRQIKRPLLVNADERSGIDVPRANLTMVTSAMPNDGKTFTCINLALSVAREKDWRVLLVDGDVANPDLSRRFGLDEEPGLIEALRNPELAVESLIVPTDVPHLSILPAGQRDEEATELLASQRMEAVLERLRHARPRAFILFDSPPLLVSTESTALAGHMGQVTLVVKAGHTTHQQVQRALELLDPDKALSLILNQAESGDNRFGYGTYGQYGYGYTATGQPGPADGAQTNN
jgi:protein-tyrosine kinase